ncbi:putative amidase [Mycobacterium tuberculosis]|nr:putative amidase [Mycobacterium tuberculosis]
MISAMTDADSAVPPRLDEDAISKLELTEVADLIRTRQLTSAEVTESTLRRIERLDPQLKSYAFVMPETALAAARAADADIARGHYEGVLHGVPIGVKDLCYTVDAPTAAGTTIFRDFRPAYDATVVARLRAAGAVIIGKLAMTEGAYLGYHPSLPTPVNPWDPTAWAGVSSSGCGVATAAGLCFGSIGSDTGGSIRFPTSMCGVTGIKPTWGRVSRHGVVELAASYDHVGPITRSAHDAAVLLSVIAGSDIHDPSCSAEPVPDYAADLALTRIPRVGVDWSQTTSFDEDTTAMLADVVKTLDDIGWPVIDVKLPALAPMVAAFGKMRAVETAIAHADTYPARADEYGPIMRAMIDAGHRLAAVEYQTLTERRLEFTRSLRRVFHDVDILLMPSAGIASPTLETMRGLGQDPELTARLAMPTAPFNVSGNPAICLPAGTTARGTPLGVQFIGREFDEHLLGRSRPRISASHRVSSPTPAGVKNPRPQKACECRTEGRGESPYWYVYEHNLWPSREDALSISAVVFDRDGVLTSFDWTRAEEDVRRITGLPLEEIERRWGGWLNGLTIDDAFVETQPISEFLSSLARELELGSKARDELVRLDYMAFAQGYPDARPALEEARRRGLKVGVLTNNSLLVSARSLLQCAALHDLVDVVLSSQMIGAAKPDPRAYQAIAEALGVSTTSCLFFDDIADWVEGARCAGMRAYLVDRSGQTRDGVVRDLSSLGAILDGAGP